MSEPLGDLFGMVTLKFYGGVDEIGGNKILLESGGTKVWFDFGRSFTMGCEFFAGWLTPRSINGLGDYFEFGLLPDLEGLYAEEQLKFTQVQYVQPRFDGVFLSHAHFDHVGHVEFLDPEIPVYVGEGTKLFLEAMEKTSGFCRYGKHEYRKFRTGEKIQMCDITAKPIHVDHSIPAAYGFLIHTSEGTIVYSGDLRMHGPRRDMTDEFADEARESEPVVMICEGTRMVEKEKRKNYSEEQVEKMGDKIVSSTDKIVFVARYSRDMDRFRSFYNAARNNDRKIVISPKTAFLLESLLRDRHLDLPSPLKDESILVYYKRKKSGRFDEKDYYVWERGFMDAMVTPDFVHKHQKELVMDLDFYQFAEMIDIRPDPGSHFIHSMSEPFSEEDIEDQVMHNWLDHLGINFHQLHASGHMNRGEIQDLVDYIRPRRIFPIHTENQQLFTENFKNVQTIIREEEYIL